MTRDEFIKTACALGYCNKKVAEEYCVGKDVFTDDDYIEVWRKAHYKEHHGRDGLHVCGRSGGKTTKSYKFYNGHEG